MRSPRTVTVVIVALALLAAGAGSVAPTAAGDASGEVVARYPSDGEMVEQTVIAPEDVDGVTRTQGQDGRWRVTLSLTTEGAESLSATLVDAGFTSDGVRSCPADGERNDQGYCLLTVVDGDVVNALGVGPSLAQSIEQGEFVNDPQLSLVTQNETMANQTAAAFGWTANESAQKSTTAGTERKPSETTDGTGESGGGAPGVGVAGGALAVLAAGALALTTD